VGVNPKAKAIQERTHRFHVRVIALCEALPRTDAARSIGRQLLDSAGSTASNYRAACRARTRKEFISKLGVAAEEADESQGWLRALVSANIGSREEASALLQEADELIAIFVKSQITAKRNLARTKAQTAGRPPSTDARF
jgi:four helix bundle protein